MAVDTMSQWTRREVPSRFERIPELAFAIEVPPEFVAPELPGEEPRFEEPTFMLPLWLGSSPVAMEGRSYKDQWWITNDDHGAYMARGIHGQSIFIDPKAEMVIVRLASQPKAFSRTSDPFYFPAYRAMAQTLMQRRGNAQAR